jgi:hypothetical protein
MNLTRFTLSKLAALMLMMDQKQKTLHPKVEGCSKELLLD